MNRLRPNATPNIKAKTMRIDDRVTGGRAISGDPTEKAPCPVSIAQLKKGKCRSDRVDRIDGLRARKIDIAKIDIHQSSGRCRQSRSNFCRACLLSKMSSLKSNPARSRIRSLPLPGFFWRKQPVTMFN